MIYRIRRVRTAYPTTYFFLGNSPERIDPGDPPHRLTTINKVTSGSTSAIAAIVDALYRQITTAGTHPASRTGDVPQSASAKPAATATGAHS